MNGLETFGDGAENEKLLVLVPKCDGLLGAGASVCGGFAPNRFEGEAGAGALNENGVEDDEDCPKILDGAAVPNADGAGLSIF